MATTPPYDIDLKGALRLVDIVKGTGDTDSIMGIDGLFKRLWSCLDPENLPGAYAHLAERLDAYYTLIQNAGAGTALVMAGTEAERAALTSPADGLWWVATDTDRAYKYNASLAEWVRLGEPMPGFIAGMQISRASDTQIIIQPGACVIGGKLYVLPSAVTTTVDVSVSWAWRAALVGSLPSSGNVLASANFDTSGTAVTGSTVTKDVNGSWIYNGYANKRVVGLYPAVSNAVVAGFKCVGGRYYCYNIAVDDSTPPTSGTDYDIRLPVIGDETIGHYIAQISGSAGTTYTALMVNGVGRVGGVGTDAISGATIHSNDGQASLYMTATGGTPDLMRLKLFYVDIPAGMAR